MFVRMKEDSKCFLRAYACQLSGPWLLASISTSRGPFFSLQELTQLILEAVEEAGVRCILAAGG